MIRRPPCRGGGAAGRGSFARGVLPFASLCLLACLASCGDSRAVPRIGVILPITGPLASGSKALLEGLELARERVAVPVEFLPPVDDENDPVLSANLVHRLDAEERVDGIFGPASSACALAAADRAERLRIPLLTPSATHEDVTKGRSWVFRVCFTDERQGSHLARFARRRGLGRAAIAKDLLNDYSLGLAQSFAETFVRDGGDVVGEFGYRGRRPEVGAEVARWLEKLDCDAVYLPTYSEDIGAILKASADVWRGRGIAFLGGDGWGGSDLPRLLKEWPKEVYITSHFDPDGEEPAVHEFVEAYRRRYGAERPLTSLAALGYDAGLLLLGALRSGARGREGIRSALDASLASFQGATGEIARDPASNRPDKDVRVHKRNGERWELVREDR